MSALGQKQTFALHQPMSALPPKADIGLGGGAFKPLARADVGLLGVDLSIS